MICWYACHSLGIPRLLDMHESCIELKVRPYSIWKLTGNQIFFLTNECIYFFLKLLWSSPSHPWVKVSEFMMKQELRWMQMSLQKSHSCPMLVCLLFCLTTTLVLSFPISFSIILGLNLRLSKLKIVTGKWLVFIFFLPLFLSLTGSQGNTLSATSPASTSSALNLSSCGSNDSDPGTHNLQLRWYNHFGWGLQSFQKMTEGKWRYQTGKLMWIYLFILASFICALHTLVWDGLTASCWGLLNCNDETMACLLLCLFYRWLNQHWPRNQVETILLGNTTGRNWLSWWIWLIHRWLIFLLQIWLKHMGW